MATAGTLSLRPEAAGRDASPALETAAPDGAGPQFLMELLAGFKELALDE